MAPDDAQPHIKRVNDRISRDPYVLCPAFGGQIFRSLPGRRKMVVGDDARERAVDLFRKRRILLAAPEARLDMRDSDLFIIACQRAGQHGSRIALNDDKIRVKIVQNFFYSAKAVAGHVKKSLIGLHYIEIIVRLYFKKIKHLVEHLAVLRRDAYSDFEKSVAYHLFDKRRQFDRLRACSKNK
ncbi:MAG: hypothetical protein BWY32_03743 [bacterium ADurb.Bin243]|nr:MAG: hypothetical protein BWY32_03743 [bacterium ADurb.Bin243]